jgi:uncharacterized protein YacL
VAFLKNRITYSIVFGMIGLAVIGLLSSVVTNPAGFFKNIAIMLVIGAIVFLLIRILYKPSPAKREQRAFVKAAKRSIKKNQHKDGSQVLKKKKHSNLTSLKKARALKRKKHSTPQLTVIEGKKGKKKNRASFL